MGAVTLFAAAPRAVIARPLRDALVPLLAALAILATLLAAASWVQLRLGLKPLGRMRAQVAAIRAGEASRLDEDQPVELRGLAAELNALAADREAALATARQSAANLAHALKTPVATLALGLRDDPAKAAQVARIDATIRHHLSRARAGTVDTRASTPVAPAIADLVQAIGRLHAGRGLSIAADGAEVTAWAVTCSKRRPKRRDTASTSIFTYRNACRRGARKVDGRSSIVTTSSGSQAALTQPRYGYKGSATSVGTSPKVRRRRTGLSATLPVGCSRNDR